jgi:hypothetical protein
MTDWHDDNSIPASFSTKILVSDNNGDETPEYLGEDGSGEG